MFGGWRLARVNELSCSLAGWACARPLYALRSVAPPVAMVACTPHRACICRPRRAASTLPAGRPLPAVPAPRWCTGTCSTSRSRTPAASRNATTREASPGLKSWIGNLLTAATATNSVRLPFPLSSAASLQETATTPAPCMLHSALLTCRSALATGRRLESMSPVPGGLLLPSSPPQTCPCASHSANAHQLCVSSPRLRSASQSGPDFCCASPAQAPVLPVHHGNHRSACRWQQF